MHPVGKVFMGIGVFVLLGGVILMVIGGENIDDTGEWNVIEKSEWNGVSGTFEFEDTGDYLVMVRDTVRCDSFTMTITNTSSGQEESYETDKCTDDGSKPSSYADDPSGWYDMGGTYYVSNGNHQIEASHEVYLVPVWEVVTEELGQAVGGLFQGAAGFVGVCCGAVIIVFGLVLGLLVNNEKQVVIQNVGMPTNNAMMQPNQTMMTQPTTIKSYADIPVEPQTMVEQPQSEGFWDQEQPKNPF